MKRENYSSRSGTVCVAREGLELSTDIRDFTTLFFVILRSKSSEWVESSMESDLAMRFAISSLDLASRELAFFKHSFWCKKRSLKGVYYWLILMIWKNKILISMICDPLVFLLFTVPEPHPPLQRIGGAANSDLV